MQKHKIEGGLPVARRRSIFAEDKLVERYAHAFYMLAEESGCVDSAARSVVYLQELFNSLPELSRLLASPLTDVQKLLSVLKACLEESSLSKEQAFPLILKFLGVIEANQRTAFLCKILKKFISLMQAQQGIVSVSITSAKELSEEQRARLYEIMYDLGITNVDLSETVDPRLLGGMIVQAGSYLYDTSLRSRLLRLENAMKGVA